MKIHLPWILFIGRRYIRSKREGRAVTPSTISIGGIAVGVTALVAVMSVMNGLQMGFIEDILEIQSYHLRISARDAELLPSAESVSTLKEVETAVLFRDTQTLVQGEFSAYQSVMVRGIEQEGALKDLKLMEHISIVDGEFKLKNGKIPGVVIGDQLARRLGLDVGDTMQMVTMRGSSFAGLQPQHTRFEVTGIFHSGYYQYDSTFSFVELENIDRIDSTSSDLVLGIKLKDRFQDRRGIRAVAGLLSNRDGEFVVQSWREYNRAFFGALKMEKLTMTTLLGLIFLVVAVNIKNSLERSVVEKREDVGILRAVGASSGSVRTVFLMEGWLIGVSGTLIGLPVGMLLSIHINRIFHGVEWVMNGVLNLLAGPSSPFGGGAGIRIFSSGAFYMQEIPVRILYGDVFGIASSPSQWRSWRPSPRQRELQNSNPRRY